MREIVRSLTEALDAGRERLVCQVVETRGSTPQKAGARMVVDPDGGQTGTLGGGCVENEVKVRAIRRIGEAGADLHSFVLDHDYAWADGLICGGRMAVLVESASGPESAAYYRALLATIESGRGHTEAALIDTERSGSGTLGARVLLDATGEPVAAIRAGRLVGRIAAGARPIESRPRPSIRDGVAYLPSLPRVRLVIVGAGHVGQAVADLAARADFDVWVVDDRAQYASRDRFPTAGRLVVGPIESTLDGLDIDARTFALIVTRGHGHDQEALHRLATTPAPYVGLIGSRRKIRLIFESLREAGVPETDLARVSAPVGLEIGSESVVEIAVSIVAELIARRNLGGPADRPRPVAAEPAGA